MKGKFTEETENREDFAEDGPRVSGVTMEGYKRAGEWVTIKSGDLPNMRTWVFKMRNDLGVSVFFWRLRLTGM